MPSAKRVRIRKPTLGESSSSGSSAHVIASNEDLLLQLLLRLPISSLIKFKSVSKDWFSLITNPHFIHRKNLKSNNTISALYLMCRSSTMGQYYDFVPLHPLHKRALFKYIDLGDDVIQIKHSCNGLLCCTRTTSYMESKHTYFIYNPTTKQFRILPPLQDQAADMWLVGVSLAFEPLKSHVYKVVCVQGRRQSSDHFQIWIYSSEIGHWRVSGAPFRLPYFVSFSNGVYCNGAIHWMRGRGVDASRYFDVSLYFDLNEELVREMPMPLRRDSSDKGWVDYFGESSGLLYLVTVKNNRATEFNVYEMERDRSGWVVKFRVDLNGVALDMYGQEYYNCIYSFSVLCVVRGEKEEDSFLVLHVPGKIIRYYFRGHTHQLICNTDPPRYHFNRQTRGLEICYTDSSRYNFRRKPHRMILDAYSLRVCGWPFVFQYIESLSIV